MDEHCCKLGLGFIRPPCSVSASSFCTFAICGSACSHAKRQQAFGIRLHRLLQANSLLLIKHPLPSWLSAQGRGSLLQTLPGAASAESQGHPQPGTSSPVAMQGIFQGSCKLLQAVLGDRAVTQRGNAGVGQAAVPCRERPLPLLVSAVIHDSRHAQCVISHEYLPVSAICHDL